MLKIELVWKLLLATNLSSIVTGNIHFTAVDGYKNKQKKERDSELLKKIFMFVFLQFLNPAYTMANNKARVGQNED